MISKLRILYQNFFLRLDNLTQSKTKHENQFSINSTSKNKIKKNNKKKLNTQSANKVNPPNF